jgi:hypothetical protein
MSLHPLLLPAHLAVALKKSHFLFLLQQHEKRHSLSFIHPHPRLFKFQLKIATAILKHGGRGVLIR